MNKRFTITEEEKRRIIGMHQIATKNHYIMEKYEGGLIMEGDDLCEIECERKIAAYGSNGDAVKEIQHALSKCGFNAKYEGGGMNEGCGENRKNCDGKFREHTRDSVKEFQRENGLTVDGKVGSDTLKKLVSEGCLDDPECDCEEQEFEQDDTKQDYVKQFDCEEVKDCMQKYLFASPVPDYSGFMQCILNNAIKDIDKRTDYDPKYKDGKLTQCSWYVDGINRYKCPEYVDCMPKIGGIDKNCNSIAIRACIKAGCTKKAV
jgi:hypothetical protein